MIPTGNDSDNTCTLTVRYLDTQVHLTRSITDRYIPTYTFTVRCSGTRVPLTRSIMMMIPTGNDCIVSDNTFTVRYLA